MEVMRYWYLTLGPDENMRTFSKQLIVVLTIVVVIAVSISLLRMTRPRGGRTSWLVPALGFLITVVASVLVVNLQLRLMDVAGDAQTLGAAMNHASLNVANALGAWLGGSVIAAGYGYRSTSLVGAALSVAGIAVLLWSAVAHRRDANSSASTS